jgi:hypothetical protein
MVAVVSASVAGLLGVLFFIAGGAVVTRPLGADMFKRVAAVVATAARCSSRQRPRPSR